MLRHLAFGAAWLPLLTLGSDGAGDLTCTPPACLAAVQADTSSQLSGSLSMLQRAAAGHSTGAALQQQGPDPSFSAEAAGAAGAGEENIPATATFRGVRMLYMKLPLSQAVLKQGLLGGILGESTDPKHGGFQLDEDGVAQVKIAYYPDALMGWSGEFGSSIPVNVPHQLLSVQLPMLQGGHKLYQTGYALTNDDTAMMLLRLGHGVPAKLANMSFFASSEAFPEGEALNVSRRGLEVLRVESLSSEGAADVKAVEELFDIPEVNWGTPLANKLAFAGKIEKLSYKKQVTKANVKAAWKAKAALSANDGSVEVFRSIFSSLEPLEAYWLEADLEVTTSLVAEAPKFFSQPGGDWSNLTKWRFQGEVTTEKRGRSGQTPRMSYHNGDAIWMRMNIDRDAVASYLPPPLTVAGDEGLLWHVRWQPGDIFNMWGVLDQKADVLPLEYNELWVTVPVSLGGKHYMYPILMMLDDDIGLVTGQDVIGCPKKMANLTFQFSPKPGKNSEVFLDITRKGRPVMQVRGKINDRKQKPVYGINDHSNPSSDILWLFSHQFPWDPKLDRPQFIPCQSAERTYDQREMTDVELTLGGTNPEPLAKWFVGKPLDAGYIKMDQDWLPSVRSPLDDQIRSMDAEGFTAWWKRSFPLLYM